MKRVLAVGGFGVAAAAAVVVVLLVTRNPSASLEFSILDAQSGGWVWDLTARVQNRYLKGYYQSDAGPIRFRFTSLSAGESELDLSAPYYEAQRVPVHLKPGVNRLDRPITMRGLEIPGLDHFLAFETPRGADLVVQLRPVNAQGNAILNHPCLPLWVGARVSVEVRDGVPVRDVMEAGTSRGRTLFRGSLAWSWDPAPESQFRYSALIPGTTLSPDPAPLRVVDYLVVVPDPRRMSAAELDSTMEGIWSLPDAAQRAALEARKDLLRAYRDTSWNVKGGGS